MTTWKEWLKNIFYMKSIMLRSIMIYGLFFGIAKYPAGSTSLRTLRSVFPLNSLTDRDRSAWPFNDQKGQTLHLLNQRPGFSLINLYPPDYKVIGYHWSQTSPRYIHKTGRLQSPLHSIPIHTKIVWTDSHLPRSAILERFIVWKIIFSKWLMTK